MLNLITSKQIWGFLPQNNNNKSEAKFSGNFCRDYFWADDEK